MKLDMWVIWLQVLGGYAPGQASLECLSNQVSAFQIQKASQPNPLTKTQSRISLANLLNRYKGENHPYLPYPILLVRRKGQGTPGWHQSLSSFTKTYRNTICLWKERNFI